MLAFELMEIFDAAGIPELVAEYLGEPAALSVDKTTLRKVEPSTLGAWHQDGRSWVTCARSTSGSPSPGAATRRRDWTSSPVVSISWCRGAPTAPILQDQVSQATAEQAAGGLPIVRPIFEPGDAVLFDELCLHQTGSDPPMRNTRFAVECWFFGGSAFPGVYAPIAV